MLNNLFCMNPACSMCGKKVHFFSAELRCCLCKEALRVVALPPSCNCHACENNRADAKAGRSARRYGVAEFVGIDLGEHHKALAAAASSVKPEQNNVQIKIEVGTRKTDISEAVSEVLRKKHNFSYMASLADHFDRIMKAALKSQAGNKAIYMPRRSGKSMLHNHLLEEWQVQLLNERIRRDAEKKQLAALFEVNLETAKRRGQIIDYTFSPETGEFTYKPVPPLESLDLSGCVDAGKYWLGVDLAADAKPLWPSVAVGYASFSSVCSTCPEPVTITQPSSFSRTALGRHGRREINRNMMAVISDLNRQQMESAVVTKKLGTPKDEEYKKLLKRVKNLEKEVRHLKARRS